MKRNLNQRSKKGAFALLEILLVLIIISLLWYVIFRGYSKKSSLSKETEKSLIDQSINTSSHQAILDSTRSKIQDINKETLNRVREMESIE